MNRIVKRLTGRAIVAIDLRPYQDEAGRTHTDPLLTLDDGTLVGFCATEQDEGGGYGVSVLVAPRPRRGRKAAP